MVTDQGTPRLLEHRAVTAALQPDTRTMLVCGTYQGHRQSCNTTRHQQMCKHAMKMSITDLGRYSELS